MELVSRKKKKKLLSEIVIHLFHGILLRNNMVMLINKPTWMNLRGIVLSEKQTRGKQRVISLFI